METSTKLVSYRCTLKPGDACPRCNKSGNVLALTEGGRYLECACGSAYAMHYDNMVYVIVTGNQDSQGKRSFFVDWHDPGGLTRAQHFHAQLSDIVTLWERRPVTVSYAPGTVEHKAL